MKCASNGLDTHEAIIRQACGIFYLPNDTGSDKPCKFYGKCQRWMERVITEEEEPIKLHQQYINGDRRCPECRGAMDREFVDETIQKVVYKCRDCGERFTD